MKIKFWPDEASKRRIKIYLGVGGFLLAGFLGWVYRATHFAGDGTVGRASGDLENVRRNLQANIAHLAGTLGERNSFKLATLNQAADWIHAQWTEQGLTVVEQRYEIPSHGTFRNLEVDVAGPAGAPIILIGAHYDSVYGSPGADDNATGVAVLMEVTRALRGAPVARRIRCVAFTNEEPPWFTSPLMGSRVYSKMARERGDPIVGMVSLETLGWYSDEPRSQTYPPGFSLLYPAEGNFVAVVSRYTDRDLVVRALEHLRPATSLPVRAGAVYSGTPGVYWSDHWSFWEEGFPALMITDTAHFRNPHYHKSSDRPDTVDLQKLADLTSGIVEMVQGLAESSNLP